MFIRVSSTRKDGVVIDHVLAVDDLAGIASNTKGTAIITQKSNDYQIWTNEEYEEVLGLLVSVGAEVTTAKGVV